MKSFGNLILMTLICVVIFMVFMAIRPAPAQTPGWRDRLLAMRAGQDHHW